MNYWLVSDTHFGHTKLIEMGRPADYEAKLWGGLARIPKEDTLIHLGDLGIGEDLQTAEKINALQFKKILVRGNHDHKSINWYCEHGWYFVCDQLGIYFHGLDILLSHRPMPPDTWRYRYNIHGHTHGNLHRAEEYISYYDDKNFHIDISPELIGFQPIRMDTLMKKYGV